MEYARKVVYNGNIVDVEDIVCPGTEKAHLSVGNLKTRMNEFAKTLNDYGVQIKTIQQNIEDEFNVVKATIEKNANSYETIVTTRLNAEKTKYDALYTHANGLIAKATTDFNELNVKYSQLDEDVTSIKEDLIGIDNDMTTNRYNDATLADQIVSLKTQFNKVLQWIAGLYKHAIDEIDDDALKQLPSTVRLESFKTNELKYEDIETLTEEWKEFLSNNHPQNKEEEEGEE